MPVPGAFLPKDLVTANPRGHPLQQVKCLHGDPSSSLSAIPPFSYSFLFIVNGIPISAEAGSSPLRPGHLPTQVTSQPAVAWENGNATL